jgi:hypothetical protein
MIGRRVRLRREQTLCKVISSWRLELLWTAEVLPRQSIETRTYSLPPENHQQVRMRNETALGLHPPGEFLLGLYFRFLKDNTPCSSR